ncbi:MAG: prepilin-type N-terminal cleavage/methylation domain-containing protein [Cellvibrionaceae bacterium]
MILFRLQRGVGLIEVMVSITISVIVLAGVLQLYASSNGSQRAQEGSSRIQENMRFAMTKMEKDFNNTGFAGCFSMSPLEPPPSQAQPAPVRIINTLGSNAGANQQNDFSTYISGSEGTGLLGTDSVIVRYASAAGKIPLDAPMQTLNSTIDIDENNPNYQSLRQYQTVIISDCSKSTIFMITNDPTTSAGIIEHNAAVVAPAGGVNPGQFNISNAFERLYGAQSGSSTAYLFAGASGAHTYSVQTSAAGTALGAACSAATPEFCALFRDNLELVEGVQDFQVEYGWQAQVASTVRPGYMVNSGDLRFCTADVCPDMSVIDRVKITMTFNSIQDAPTNDGSRLVTKTVSKVFSIRNQLPLG